jgi:mRNA-degrading endonuclease toxin of MazEF toxin-antitoxin module
MLTGEIYWADVPFRNRPGSKIRPVMVVSTRFIPTVVVLASTSQYKPNLTHLHTVDFSSVKYSRIQAAGLRGMSYFYEENLTRLDEAQFRRFIGKMSAQDLKIILDKLDS